MLKDMTMTLVLGDARALCKGYTALQPALFILSISTLLYLAVSSSQPAAYRDSFQSHSTDTLRRYSNDLILRRSLLYLGTTPPHKAVPKDVAHILAA